MNSVILLYNDFNCGIEYTELNWSYILIVYEWLMVFYDVYIKNVKRLNHFS